ncbi:hypothetical protein [Streptomyces sp. SID8374]|uniref:hypothetical protein n=1 Tax=Streptomyces sp. SID8374 TaxID=2690354 RepID=UPI001F1599E7|nr:hypothetical protein [Streptomyces sp. SID8374]
MPFSSTDFAVWAADVSGAAEADPVTLGLVEDDSGCSLGLHAPAPSSAVTARATPTRRTARPSVPLAPSPS